MIKKLWIVVLCFVLVLAVTVSCQFSSTDAEASKATGETTVYGQVTAIDSSSITLALGTVSQGMTGSGGEKPEGTPPDGMAGGQGAPPEEQSGSNSQTDVNSSATQNNPTASGEQPDAVSSATENTDESVEQPSVQGGNGGAIPGGIDLTGEELTITVTDSTVVTLQGMGERTEGLLADIEVGSILSVTMSGDTVTAIAVMQSRSR